MDSHKPALQISSWFLFVVSSAAVATRLWIKRSSAQHLGLDDALIAAALFASIGSGIAVSIAADSGLGSERGSLAEPSLAEIRRAIYAAELLYLSALCLAKLSVVDLLRKVFPTKRQVRVHLAFAVAITGTWLVSFLVVIFQCSIPFSGEFITKKCINITAFWRFFGGASLSLDLALVIAPLCMVSRVHITLKKKLIVASCFSARISSLAAVATQLAYTQTFESPDNAYDLWTWALISQLAQTASIVSACIPYLRQFFEALPSGMMCSNEIQRRGLNLTDISHGYISDSAGLYILTTNVTSSRLESQAPFPKAAVRNSRGDQFSAPRRVS